jgi:predicted CopG family antitoxin
MPKKLITIAVSHEVYEALREKGKTGDSFDRVLRKILGVMQ